MPPAETLLFDWAFLAAFVAFGLLCWYFRIPYRVSILAGVILLFGVAVAVLIEQEDVGNFAAIPAFYFLVVGIALAVIEFWGKESRKNLVPKSTDDSRSPDQPAASSRTSRVRSILRMLRGRL